jgi:hypothetical protein
MAVVMDDDFRTPDCADVTLLPLPPMVGVALTLAGVADPTIAMMGREAAGEVVFAGNA